jgi:hypothetical protein
LPWRICRNATLTEFPFIANVLRDHHAKSRKTGPEPVDFLALKPLGWYIYPNRYKPHG